MSDVRDFAMWMTTRPQAVQVGGEHTVYAMIDALREWEAMQRNKLAPPIVAFDKGSDAGDSMAFMLRGLGGKVAADGPKVTMGQERVPPVDLGVFQFRGLQAAVDARAKYIDPEERLGPLFFATELGGECGEALNVVKKLERERLEIGGRVDTVEHLAKELSDTIITACNLARCYGISLHPAIVDTFNATSAERHLPVTLR